MSQNNKKIATLLSENGFSVTRQRLLVFGLLENQEPIAMHELYKLTKNDLDRASLYRIINVFEKLGIVSRISIGWKYKIELSDMFADHHHHLSCINCHKVVSINENELEGFINRLALSHDFMPTEHQIEVQGYCTDCVPLKH
jgi:Fur family ferric uptake transcriptional regulator